MSVHEYPATSVPWPAAVRWTRQELGRYLESAADATARTRPTRCAPWNVDDLTAHLAATFRRFADLLERARAGDLCPPFPPDRLAAENLRAVREFTGDPPHELDLQANRFLRLVAAPGERMANQLGVVPAGLQVMFGLNELAVHHDDLAHAAGGSYRPAEEIVAALAGMYDAVFGLPAAAETDPWHRLLLATGRSAR